jgi:hypothetical protein
MSRGTHMTGNRQWWRRETSTGDARKDAAAHLSLMARRFANERANAREVEDAITMWRDAVRAPPPGASPRPDKETR